MLRRTFACALSSTIAMTPAVARAQEAAPAQRGDIENATKPNTGTSPPSPQQPAGADSERRTRDVEDRTTPSIKLSVPPLRRRPNPNALPPVTGQGPRIGDYYVLRYNDLYPVNKPRLFGALKNVALDPDGDISLSLSGDERIRGLYQTYNSFAGAGEKDQWIVHLKHQLSADLTLGETFRVFGQVISGNQFGINDATPAPPRQRDDLDLAQGFVEAHTPLAQGVAGIRAGRQQVHFGSGQIIATQANANLIRNYDGVRAFYYAPKLRVDLFALRPVAPAIGVFDDATDDQAALWGAYVSTPLVRARGVSLNIDPFYVGNRSVRATFNGVTGRDERASFGARLWGRLGSAQLDYAYILQRGTFAGKNVRAGFLQTKTTVPLQSGDNPVELELQFDIGTGGRRDGRTVKTYNPLYAANQYIVINAFLSRTNIVDLSPGVLVPLARRAGIEFTNRWYWRYSMQDAVYGQNLSVLGPSLRTTAPSIGMQPSADLRWTISDNLELRVSAGYFTPSEAMRAAGLRRNATGRSELTFVF